MKDKNSPSVSLFVNGLIDLPPQTTDSVITHVPSLPATHDEHNNRRHVTAKWGVPAP